MEDLDEVTADWNKWADKEGMKDYSAWLLTPFYSGPEQEFDVIWLGASNTSAGMGRAQDAWLASGGKIAAEFARVSSCDIHAQFAAVNFKEPPDSDDPPSNVVMSFSDCKIADGKNFDDDVAPAIAGWAEFRKSQGSPAAHWILFPVYGGGGEEFDFKYVMGYRNFEEQGADWDTYDPDKAGELFSGNVSCDSSRVYTAVNRRRAEDM